MAGLLAWAADVVGGGGGGDSEGGNHPNSIPLIFTPQQLTYVQQLDRKSASLNRSIQDLRLRLPPPDISQRLPHIHAHSLASNNALALQLNAHSATKQQAQLREVTLQEENAEYQNAISNCEMKIQEKLQEADLLRSKLKEMDLIEQNLKAELQRAKASLDASNSGEKKKMFNEFKSAAEAQEEEDVPKPALLEKLENKKKELASIEELVQELEKKWQQVQENALKQPTPAQREKTLDKQLHSLIEQLAVKQAQAEGLISEIHLKEMELEKLNVLWKKIESSSLDANTARNRVGRNSSFKESVSSDYYVDPQQKLPIHTAGRSESLQRMMLLRQSMDMH
ncbi:uncharacterized protein LOC105177748 isoform X2 [Sesamum indicum]|uniref:Uncharacterized protein LOC105177748 isoform X2 n=1 Tax=Sesamum indicum TaxID=4182 RepID=A0A6I9UW16_SESIN|nr:uncharacterized protein LOC105177748 isoform X2 [Sesamum indicum]